jgi:cytochrome c oxidase subunit II
MDTEFRLFPDQASTIAPEVDQLYFFLVGVSVLFTGLICILIIYFATKYRRGTLADRRNPPVSFLLEIAWSVVPLMLVMVFFFWGARLFAVMQRPPAGAMPVYVVGKQWMWKLQHPEGRLEINELHVPRNRPVRLQMISQDVIHSFYIPAFRVKMDVLPGRYTSLWFEATQLGRHHLFCAEYCGTDHSRMVGTVHVLSPQDYSEWLAGFTGEVPEELGQRLFERHRCHTCHHKGPDARGPSLDGLYGSLRTLRDGTQVVADDEYIRRSILDPQAEVVAGFEPIMPSFRGQIGEEEILHIIAYIRSLSEEDAPGAEIRGEEETLP